ncbi:MAG: EthD domain-containing protein [Pseudomonadales bacterium]|nr:EthD domain-containing protein [Pseudomonadales bacterium]
MIRLTYALRRKQGMSFEDFQQYWLEQHGPLVASHSRRLDIKRYIQVHSLKNPDQAQTSGLRGEMQTPYDGVAELWFDSREAILRMFNDKNALAAGAELLEDEKKFIDLSQSPAWIGYECPQINPSPENLVASPDSPYTKLYYLLNHPQDQQFNAVQLYWRQQHGPLVRKYGAALQALRYIQVHRLEDEINTLFARSRGTETQAYFGHAELWHDQRNGTGQIPEAKRASKALFEDEANFIDFSRSCMWYAKENVIFDFR